MLESQRVSRVCAFAVSIALVISDIEALTNSKLDAHRVKQPVSVHEVRSNPKHQLYHVVTDHGDTAQLRCISSMHAPANLVASINYTDASFQRSRFGQIRLTTNNYYDDHIQMRAAGFAEGYATAERIYDHWVNTEWWLKNSVGDGADGVDRIYAWLADHDHWLLSKLAKMSKKRWKAGLSSQHVMFWDGMKLVMEQFQGMLDGYNARVQELKAAAVQLHDPIPDLQTLNRVQLLTINSMGDMDDLIPMLFPPAYHHMSAPRLRAHLASSGRCSALVKVTGGLSDLLVGHVTWWTYTSCNRIYKHWNTPLNHPHLKAPRISFSSYPGQISSMDDWYILSSKLVVTETSNNVYDQHLYRKATAEAALSWQRMRVAHMWAHDGPSWVLWLRLHNSGTYNNQYMVVDLSKFTPGQELQKGLLTVAEQIPGEVLSADATQELERGYWPSYNVPYFEGVYNKSGYPTFMARMSARGPDFEAAVSGLRYQLAPRAKIFRRDVGSVTDLESLKRMLRYNNYTADPYSDGSAWHTICSRGDQDAGSPDADGCNDAKVTNYTMALELAAEAINAPPYDGSLQPFAWSGRWANYSHRGIPDVMSAEFELQKP